MPVRPESDAFKSPESLSDQFNKTFGSAIQEVGGVVDGFLKTAPTSAGQALSNINAAAGVLGKLGMSAMSSVSQSLNQLGSLGSYTKFKDTFVPPSKISSLSPEDTSRSNYRFLKGLTYPDNLGEYWIKFTFTSYRKAGPLQPKLDLPEITINLPIPTSLQEQFSMQYSDKQLGVAGAIEEKFAGIDLTTTQGAEAGGKKLRELASDSTVLAYGARAIMGAVDSATGLQGTATVEKAVGAVLNPFQALIFQGVNLRSHSFTYRFSPNSEKENNTLKEIIYEFKRRMHPFKEGFLYRFPNLVNISFGKKEGEPYFFKECFLETMSVNYAPQGTPAFFAESSNPVEVELTLNFKETSPVTREDIKSPEQPVYYP